MKATGVIGLAILLGVGWGICCSFPKQLPVAQVRIMVEGENKTPPMAETSQIDRARDYDDYYIPENAMPRLVLAASR